LESGSAIAAGSFSQLLCGGKHANLLKSIREARSEFCENKAKIKNPGIRYLLESDAATHYVRFYRFGMKVKAD
jgi:hypothetical protein